VGWPAMTGWTKDLTTPIKMWLMRAMAAYRHAFRSCPISSVAIETSQHCNRRCGYCPVSIAPKPVQNISRDVFAAIIDQLRDLGFDGILKYHFFNEPLLNKDLEKLIAYARSELPRARSIVYTNGDALTESRAVSLFRAGAQQLIVTNHGGRPSTEFILKARRRVRWPWAKLVFRHITPATFLFSRGGLVHVALKRQFSFCAYPAYEIVIDILGNVILCCNDYHGSQRFGNILDVPLIQIWESSRMVTLRAELLRGTFKLDLCQKCVNGVQPELPAEELVTLSSTPREVSMLRD